MFSGFTDDTVRFFIDLKFHNNASFFHDHHDRYVEVVQQPFYSLIDDLAPLMLEIDPTMETRPYKCLSRIHRDTRFSRDKSPYRDHHWFLFRKASEPREGSLFYFFEFGPERLGWGVGVWGENRELFDRFRRKMAADPDAVTAMFDSMDLEGRNLHPDGRWYKRMEIPKNIPDRLKTWYTVREVYIGKSSPPFRLAFSGQLTDVLQQDFRTLAPFYRELRGCADDPDTGNDEKRKEW